jgi:hypothetical protein
MAITALLQFNQGIVPPVAGRALLGTVGTPVTVSNSNNANVTQWKFQLHYVPVGLPASSALLLADYTQGPGGTNNIVFLPDVAGCYRWQLWVYDDLGNVDTDIRNFGVALPGGFIKPPYQDLPKPLPLVGPGAKPDELNFLGQPFGWAGNANPKMLDALIYTVDLMSTTPSASTLEQVLDNGNTTSSHDIIVSNGDELQFNNGSGLLGKVSVGVDAATTLPMLNISGVGVSLVRTQGEDTTNATAGRLDVLGSLSTLSETTAGWGYFQGGHMLSTAPGTKYPGGFSVYGGNVVDDLTDPLNPAHIVTQGPALEMTAATPGGDEGWTTFTNRVAFAAFTGATGGYGLYGATVSGNTELHYKNENGDITQLTPSQPPTLASVLVTGNDTDGTDVSFTDGSLAQVARALTTGTWDALHGTSPPISLTTALNLQGTSNSSFTGSCHMLGAYLQLKQATQGAIALDAGAVVLGSGDAYSDGLDGPPASKCVGSMLQMYAASAPSSGGYWELKSGAFYNDAAGTSFRASGATLQAIPASSSQASRFYLTNGNFFDTSGVKLSTGGSIDGGAAQNGPLGGTWQLQCGDSLTTGEELLSSGWKLITNNPATPGAGGALSIYNGSFYLGDGLAAISGGASLVANAASAAVAGGWEIQGGSRYDGSHALLTTGAQLNILTANTTQAGGWTLKGGREGTNASGTEAYLTISQATSTLGSLIGLYAGRTDATAPAAVAKLELNPNGTDGGDVLLAGGSSASHYGSVDIDTGVLSGSKARVHLCGPNPGYTPHVSIRGGWLELENLSADPSGTFETSGVGGSATEFGWGKLYTKQDYTNALQVWFHDPQQQRAYKLTGYDVETLSGIGTVNASRLGVQNKHILLTGAGAVNFYLPTGTNGILQNAVWWVKDDGGNAGTYTYTIYPAVASGNTIDGAPSFVLPASKSAVTLMYISGDWKVM